MEREKHWCREDCYQWRKNWFTKSLWGSAFAWWRHFATLLKSVSGPFQTYVCFVTTSSFPCKCFVQIHACNILLFQSLWGSEFNLNDLHWQKAELTGLLNFIFFHLPCFLLPCSLENINSCLCNIINLLYTVYASNLKVIVKSMISALVSNV